MNRLTLTSTFTSMPGRKRTASKGHEDAPDEKVAKVEPEEGAAPPAPGSVNTSWNFDRDGALIAAANGESWTVPWFLGLGRPLPPVPTESVVYSLTSAKLTFRAPHPPPTGTDHRLASPLPPHPSPDPYPGAS